MARLNASLSPRCRRWTTRVTAKPTTWAITRSRGVARSRPAARTRSPMEKVCASRCHWTWTTSASLISEGRRPEHPRQGQSRGGSGQRADDDDEQRHRDRGHGGREQHDPLGNTQAGHAGFLHLDTVRHRRHLLTTSSAPDQDIPDQLMPDQDIPLQLMPDQRHAGPASCRTSVMPDQVIPDHVMPDQRHAGPASCPDQRHAGPATSRTSSCRSSSRRSCSAGRASCGR